MKNCPHCGKRLRPLKFSIWKVLHRAHSYRPYASFKVHALLNSAGEWFGYVLEEGKEQEFFCGYKGNASWASSVGTISRSLKEAKDKLEKLSLTLPKEVEDE